MSEPVAWEYRWLDSNPYTVTSGQWSEWTRVVPRNVYTDTVQDMVNEIQYYIDQGYNYELRKLYAAPVEWVSMTDQEIADAVGSPIDEVYLRDFRNFENKLREKNTL